jgi:hypothetical protein
MPFPTTRRDFLRRVGVGAAVLPLHNCLLMSFAHAFGHRIDKFGHPAFCGDEPLPGLT